MIKQILIFGIALTATLAAVLVTQGIMIDNDWIAASGGFMAMAGWTLTKLLERENEKG